MRRRVGKVAERRISARKPFRYQAADAAYNVELLKLHALPVVL